jgi:hypothetical protein
LENEEKPSRNINLKKASELEKRTELSIKK